MALRDATSIFHLLIMVIKWINSVYQLISSKADDGEASLA